MNCMARIIDNHKKINIESNLKKNLLFPQSCASNRAKKNLKTCQASPRLSRYEPMEAVVAFEPSPQLSVLLGKEGGRCMEKPLKSPGFPRKKAAVLDFTK